MSELDHALVTVAMPVYNGARFLAEALRSVREQSHRQLEIVISDNASTDATPEICRAAAAEDPRIAYVRHERPLPVWKNFDYGRERKRGAYFMWAADDDLRDREYVAKLMAALRSRPDAVLAYSWTQMTDADLKPMELIRGYDERICSPDLVERVRAFASHHYRVPTYGLMPSKAVDAMPPLAGRGDNDGEFLFRLMLHGPFVTVPEALFTYRFHRPIGYHDTILEPRKGDAVLARLHMYRELLRHSSLDEATKRRALDALHETMSGEARDRFQWLAGELLRAQGPRARRLRTLFTFGRQYPEAMRTRFFWGAVRRIVL